MPENADSSSRTYRRTCAAFLLTATPLFVFGAHLIAASWQYSIDSDGLSYSQYMSRQVVSGFLFSVFALPVTATGACILVRVKNYITCLVGTISAFPFLLAINVWTSLYNLPAICTMLAFAPILIACSLLLPADTRQHHPPTT